MSGTSRKLKCNNPLRFGFNHNASVKSLVQGEAVASTMAMPWMTDSSWLLEDRYFQKTDVKKYSSFGTKSAAVLTITLRASLPREPVAGELAMPWSSSLARDRQFLALRGDVFHC